MRARHPGAVLPALAAAAALWAGCSRAKSADTARLPAADGVWFEEGVIEGSPETETALLRGGFGSVFLPVVALLRDGSHWTAKEASPPARPFEKVPVTLIVSAGEDAQAALADPAGVSSLDDAVWLACKAALRGGGGRFGRLRGIHLDVPFSAREAVAYAALLQRLRSKLPRETLLTYSLRFPPSEEERPGLRKIAETTDGALAFVFGDGSTADPVTTDQLEAPWLATYAPAARGRWTPAGGVERAVPERVLARLTDDPRAEFAHDLTLKEESASAFVVTAHEPVSVDDFRLRKEDRVRFRQPSLSDMAYRLGADLAGRRHVRGRVVLLSGRTEAERVFTLAALDDILLGHPLSADLRISIEAGRDAVTIGAENPTPHASLISRTSNWVEIDLPGGGIADVRPGGFDRFEVFGPDGAAVSLGRATRVRFFETLVGPLEKIEPARIVVRRPPAKNCCAHRVHVLSSAGAEVSREGDAETTPAPSPAPAGRR